MPPLPGLLEFKPSRAQGHSSSWSFRLCDASGGSAICNYYQFPGSARNGGLRVQDWVSLRQSHGGTCHLWESWLSSFRAGRWNIAFVSGPWAQ